MQSKKRSVFDEHKNPSEKLLLVLNNPKRPTEMLIYQSALSLFSCLQATKTKKEEEKNKNRNAVHHLINIWAFFTPARGSFGYRHTKKESNVNFNLFQLLRPSLPPTPKATLLKLQKKLFDFGKQFVISHEAKLPKFLAIKIAFVLKGGPYS